MTSVATPRQTVVYLISDSNDSDLLENPARHIGFLATPADETRASYRTAPLIGLLLEIEVLDILTRQELDSLLGIVVIPPWNKLLLLLA